MKKLIIAGIVLFLVLAGCSRPAGEYLDRGDTLFKQGKLTEAALSYRKAISKDAKLGKAYLGIGKTALQGNDFGEAYRALTVALQLMPDDAEVLRLQSEVAMGAYLIDPKHPAYLKANLLTVADRLERLNPKTPEGLKIRGLVAATEGEHRTALDYFRQASARDPRQLGIKLLEIQALRQSGNERGAENEAKLLVQNSPGFGPGYDWLLQYYASQKRSVEVEELLRRKAEANPGNIEFQLQLAKLRFQSGRKAEASQTVQHAAENPAESTPMSIGDYYASVGETELAMGFYRQGLNKSPQVRLIAKKKIANLLNAKGRHAEALDLIAQVRKENRNDEEAVRADADFRVQAGGAKNFELAVKIYRELLNRNPGDPAVRFNLAQTLLAQGDKNGRRELEKCIGVTPNHVPAIMRLAQIYRASNEYRDLLNLADRILAADSNSVGGRILRAEGLLGLGRATEARNLLATPVEDAGLKVDGALLTARALVAEGQLERAEQLIRKLYVPGSLDLRPLNALSDLLLSKRAQLKGSALGAFGEQVVALWSQELARYPTSKPVRKAFAKACYLAGKHDRSIQMSQQLLAADPGDIESHTLLAAALFSLGRRDEAMALLKKASELPGSNANLIEGLIAYIYSKEGDGPSAELYYNHILTRDPKNAFAMNNLAFTLADRGDKLEQAQNLASGALALEPENPEFLDTMAYVALKAGRHQEAATRFASLTTKYPLNPGIHYHHALALLALGQREHANRELAAAIGNSPDANLLVRIKKTQELAR